jgi:D-arabinose 5-phosphate isomerase GutQ
MNVCSVCQRSILRFPFCDSKECVGNLSTKIHFYTDQLQSSRSSLEEVIKGIVSELVQTQGIIYITGVGKSGHIARKTIATWQSLGIRAHFLSPQDALHGDVGILRKEDLVIHISNSGNTEKDTTNFSFQ